MYQTIRVTVQLLTCLIACSALSFATNGNGSNSPQQWLVKTTRCAAVGLTTWKLMHPLFKRSNGNSSICGWISQKKPQFIVNFPATFDDTGGYLKIQGKSSVSHCVFLISLWKLPTGAFCLRHPSARRWDRCIHGIRKSLNNWNGWQLKIWIVPAAPKDS